MRFHEITNLGKSIKESGVVPSTGREQKTVRLLGDRVHTLAVSYVSNITWQSNKWLFFFLQTRKNGNGSDLQFVLGQSMVMACQLLGIVYCHPETNHAHA